MKDLTRNLIEEGDIVAYVTRDSCYPYLNIAIVVNVEPKKIQVRSIRSSFFTSKKYLSKPVWLHFSDRIIRLEASQIDEDDYFFLNKALE